MLVYGCNKSTSNLFYLEENKAKIFTLLLNQRLLLTIFISFFLYYFSNRFYYSFISPETLLMNSNVTAISSNLLNKVKAKSSSFNFVLEIQPNTFLIFQFQKINYFSRKIIHAKVVNILLK